MKLKLLALISFSFLMSAQALAAGEPYHEGFEYARIVPPQPTQVPVGKIELVEVFWFGCPSCYVFEPHLEKWAKAKPANVVLIRIPAQFNDSWKIHARAFYTAEVLNVGDKIQQPFFEEYHVKGNRLDSKEKLQAFFERFGVKKEQFNAAFDSPAVNKRLQDAEILAAKYAIQAVPSLVVDGKYRAAKSQVDNSDEKLIQVLDFLIKKSEKGG